MIPFKLLLNNPIIAFDFDSTIVDSWSPLERAAKVLYGFDIPYKNHVTYRIDSAERPFTNEQMKSIFDMAFDVNNDLEPLRDSFKYLKQIYQKTKTSILIITARKYYHDQVRKIMDEKLDAPYDIIFNHPIPKYYYLQRLNIKYFVDDRFKEINECAPFVEKMFCIKHPWNQNRAFLNDNIEIINDLGETLKWL